MLETGTLHGCPMPIVRPQIPLIHDIEEKKRDMDWKNLDLLDCVRRE